MSNIDTSLLDRLGRRLDNTGGPPDDPRMDARVKALEKFTEDARGELRAIDVRLTKIETRLDTFATKEDVRALGVELHRELHATTWKLIGAMGLICAAVFWMARNIEPPRTALPASILAAPAPAPALAPTAPAPVQPTAK